MIVIVAGSIFDINNQGSVSELTERCYMLKKAECSSSLLAAELFGVNKAVCGLKKVEKNPRDQKTRL